MGAVQKAISGWLSVVETTTYSVVGHFDVAETSPWHDYLLFSLLFFPPKWYNGLLFQTEENYGKVL